MEVDQVAVLGAGDMGLALTKRLAESGVRVNLSSRRPPAARDQARRCIASDALTNVKVLPGRSAIEPSQMIILALPFDVALRLAHRFPAFAGGRVVVDVSNPMRGPDRMTSVESCAAVELARAIPFVHLAKAFNTLLATDLARGTSDGLVTYYSTDDPVAARAVTDLSERMNLTAVNAGPLINAQLLEGIVWLRTLLPQQRACEDGGSIP